MFPYVAKKVKDIISVKKIVNCFHIIISDSDTELYIRMKDYICERIYDTFKVEHMCTEFHYSKTYLSTIFKKHSNMTMQAFYMSKKIEEAKKLLLSINHSIAEIADMLSFANPYHFSNAFKKHTGHTPSMFRKSLQA